MHSIRQHQLAIIDPQNNIFIALLTNEINILTVKSFSKRFTGESLVSIDGCIRVQRVLPNWAWGRSHFFHPGWYVSFAFYFLVFFCGAGLGTLSLSSVELGSPNATSPYTIFPLRYWPQALLIIAAGSCLDFLD